MSHMPGLLNKPAWSRFVTQEKNSSVSSAAQWWGAGLLSAALFFAENYLPSQVVDGSSVDLQVSKLQGSSLREIAYVLIAAIGASWLVSHRKRHLPWQSPVLIGYGLLLLWCLLSVVWSQEPMVSAKRLLAYLLMLTGALGMVASWAELDLLRFISLSAAAHLTIGILAESVTGYFTPWQAGYRFAGTLHWNEQGFCCLLLALSSLAASDATPHHRVFYRGLALYGLVFLLLTHSRSSLAGVALGLLVYLLLTRPVHRNALFAICTATLGLLLYVTGWLDPVLASLSRQGEGADNFTGRAPLWDLAAVFIRQRPLGGFGYEDFWTTANVDYFSNEFHWSISAAHNGYLEALLTLGWVGLILHVSVLLIAVFLAVRSYRRTRGPVFALAAAVCLAFLAVSGLEALLFTKLSPSNFYVVLLLLATGLCATSPPVPAGALLGSGPFPPQPPARGPRSFQPSPRSAAEQP